MTHEARILASGLGSTTPSCWLGGLEKLSSGCAGLPVSGVHILPHWAAKLRRDAGEPIGNVSRFLDHSSLAVTTIYLRRLEGQEDRRWRSVAAALGAGTHLLTQAGRWGVSGFAAHGHRDQTNDPLRYRPHPRGGAQRVDVRTWWRRGRVELPVQRRANQRYYRRIRRFVLVRRATAGASVPDRADGLGRSVSASDRSTPANRRRTTVRRGETCGRRRCVSYAARANSRSPGNRLPPV